MLATLPIISFGMLINVLGFSEKISTFFSSSFFLQILYIFIGIALIEEILKYLVVRGKVLRSPELDEPIDVMLYMIIAALGFAALENILILWGNQRINLSETLWISGIRFISATFLHALVSGTFGYFLALSLFDIKNQKKLLFGGLGAAIALHGFYDLFIIEIEGVMKIIIPGIILISLALFISWGFRRLKKMKSICKIK
jgi:RsiW-degrading membrane proteinase PrsW (M82 family)